MECIEEIVRRIVTEELDRRLGSVIGQNASRLERGDYRGQHRAYTQSVATEDEKTECPDRASADELLKSGLVFELADGTPFLAAVGKWTASSDDFCALARSKPKWVRDALVTWRDPKPGEKFANFMA